MVVFVLSIGACNKQKEDDSIIARCYGYDLKKSEIKNLVNENSSPLDSIAIVKSYINNWTKQMAILAKAEQNLSDEQKNVENELIDYRNSLIVYKYERELIRQQLDTIVTDDEIEKYYKNNPNNFELKDNIVKAFYLKVGKDAPKLDDVKKWYRSTKDEDRIALDEYCFQFGEDYILGDDDWMTFKSLLKKAGIQTSNVESYLRYNKYIETSDSSYIYFIRINDFKLKASTSPLEFEKENIKNLILNQSKLSLIKEMELDAIENALNNNEIEIFD